jgi:hypothetical protein
MRYFEDFQMGDTFALGSLKVTVLERRHSRSRPNLGIIHSSCELFNQAGDVIMTMKGVHFVGRCSS